MLSTASATAQSHLRLHSTTTAAMPSKDIYFISPLKKYLFVCIIMGRQHAAVSAGACTGIRLLRIVIGGRELPDLGAGH